MRGASISFIHVLVGSTVSQLGDVGFMLALPWLVLKMTGSGLTLGSVMMALALPRALLMLVGGAFSDRYPARTVLAVAYTAQALCVALIAVLFHAQALNLHVLYLVAFCFGVADAFVSPALRVLLPSLVPPDGLQRANALLQSSAQLCVLAGSAVCGLLIARWGLLWVFVVDAASYVYIIAVLLCLAARPRVAAPAGKAAGIRRAILDGLRYVWHDAGLRTLLIGFTCINFCTAGATQIGLAMLASERYGSSGLGILMSCAAAGSLAGLALAGKWRPAVSVHQSIAVSALMLSALLAALALTMPLWWVCLDAALLGALAGFVNIGVLSWLQGSVRGDMLGRVMSVLGLASTGIMPLSLALSGLVARFSLSAMFLGAGGLLLLTMFIMRRAVLMSSAPA